MDFEKFDGKNYIKINHSFFFDIHTSNIQTQYLSIHSIFYEHKLLILIIKNKIYKYLTLFLFCIQYINYLFYRIKRFKQINQV